MSWLGNKTLDLQCNELAHSTPEFDQSNHLISMVGDAGKLQSSPRGWKPTAMLRAQWPVFVSNPVLKVRVQKYQNAQARFLPPMSANPLESIPPSLGRSEWEGRGERSLSDSGTVLLVEGISTPRRFSHSRERGDLDYGRKKIPTILLYDNFIFRGDIIFWIRIGMYIHARGNDSWTDERYETQHLHNVGKSMDWPQLLQKKNSCIFKNQNMLSP